MRSVGLREEIRQGEPELRRRLERAQAERVHEHEPAEPVAVLTGEAGRDGAAEQLSHQSRRRLAGLLDQPAQPLHDASGIDRPSSVTSEAP